MSALDCFVRMRLYRKRAEEFEQLAWATQDLAVRRRYHLVAERYRELAEFENRSDKVRVAERLKAMRQERLIAAQ
jgi:hypothetical protein